MGAVAYTSTLADADFYEAEREREYPPYHKCPTWKKMRSAKSMQKKGFRGDLLERIVETITANKDVWVAVMMARSTSSRLSTGGRR